MHRSLGERKSVFWQRGEKLKKGERPCSVLTTSGTKTRQGEKNQEKKTLRPNGRTLKGPSGPGEPARSGGKPGEKEKW